MESTWTPEVNQSRTSSPVKKWVVALLVLALFLIIAWVTAPYGVQWYLNRALGRLPDYEGSVGTVGLHHILRGAFVIDDIQIQKRNQLVKQPFVKVSRVDAQFDWSGILHGKIKGKIFLDAPAVYFVKGPSAARSQTGLEKEWQDVVQDLIPFQINLLKIRRGELRFIATDTHPPVDIFLRDLDLDGKNMTNTKEKPEQNFATFDLSGKAIGNGELKAHAKSNPLTKPLPNLNLFLELTHVDLRALNPFLQAYGGFDVHRGRFDFYFEMKSDSKSYHGYAKPILSDIDVLDWERDTQRLNALQVAWKALVGTAMQLLKNQPKDRLASVIPFKGTWQESDVNAFAAVGNLLRNAFIKALVPGFENKSGPSTQ